MSLLATCEKRAGKALPKLREHIKQLARVKSIDGFEDLGAAVVSTSYLIIDSVPRTANEVMNLDAKSYTGMLKDGAFIINRIAEEVNLYEPYTDCVLNLIELATGTITSISAHDWWTKQFMFTFVMYENLSSLTTETGTVSGNHIFQKWYNGVEIAPTIHSSMVPFAEPCAMEDDMALKLANNLMHACPAADVAATNSLGTLLSAAISVAPTVIDWIKNVFGKKETTAPKDNTQAAEIARLTARVAMLSAARQADGGYYKRQAATATKVAAQKARTRSVRKGQPTVDLSKEQKKIRERAKKEPISLTDYMRLPSGKRP